MSTPDQQYKLNVRPIQFDGLLRDDQERIYAKLWDLPGWDLYGLPAGGHVRELRDTIEQIAEDVASIKRHLAGVSPGGILIPTARDIAALAKTRKV